VSSYGYTRQIAEKISETIKRTMPDIHTAVYDANAIDVGTLSVIMNNSKAFCIGCPTLNKNALPPIINLLNNIDMINNKDQNVLIFGSYG
jgi:flavorubredoxin